MVSPHFLYAAIAVGVGAAWLAFPKATTWVQANQLMFLGASLGFFFSYPGLHSLIGLCLGGWLGHFIHQTLRNAFYVATHPRQLTGQVVSHLWKEAKSYVSGPAPTESIHHGSAHEAYSEPNASPSPSEQHQTALSYFPMLCSRLINTSWEQLKENAENERDGDKAPFSSPFF